MPASSHKEELRLAEHLQPDGSIGEAGIVGLIRFIVSCLQFAEDYGVEEMVAFATSAIREATNGEQVLARVSQQTGVDLQVLPGGDEARLTFLAVRRWFGWSAGRLLMLDIGGGSLEIGAGLDESPDVAISLPLGAGRLTLDRLPGDPPTTEAIRAARRYIRAEIARVVPDVKRPGVADRTVGTSKTFRSLARLCGAASSDLGDYVPRVLRQRDLASWVPRLAAMPVAQRAGLHGVSAGRSAQLLAGALVAEAAMELLGVDQLQVCPWALREGIILRRLDLIATRNG